MGSVGLFYWAFKSSIRQSGGVLSRRMLFFSKEYCTNSDSIGRASAVDMLKSSPDKLFQTLPHS
ncbi:hypothetical protein [Porphyromonas gingivicanis]|uniref:hypothetical protein n=1 Tax=Porphyromonas gingivicanis TaxID=266762 RepID=UPI000B1DD1D5|nr:hypothetical protein [Porphyromonas gingivicanis]